MTLLAKNKKAYFNLNITEKWDAGIALSGSEVKSVKGGQVNLKGSFISVWNNEAWLEGAHIAKYRLSGEKDYNPRRRRKLLLRKNEITKLSGLLGQKGATIVPLEIYEKGNLIKVLIGLGTGKKKYDKRDAIKKRHEERIIERAFKRHSR